MRKLWVHFILLAAAISWEAVAPEVLKLGANKRFAIVSHGEKAPWEVNDNVCLYRGPIEVGCGKVVKTTQKAAVIKLVTRREVPEEGDSVRRSAPKRLAPSTESVRSRGARSSSKQETVEPSATTQDRKYRKKKKFSKTRKRRPHKSSRRSKKRKKSKRELALMKESHRTKAYLYDRLIREGKDTTLYTADITLGGSVGINHLYPLLHCQFAITRKIAVGIAPFYFSATSEDASVSAFGGHATFNFYNDYTYRGLWVQGGVGGMKFSASVPSVDESAFVLSFLGTVGWRQRWDLGINVGAGLGLQYIFDPKFTVVDLNYRNLQFVLIVDFGINF